MKRFTEEELEFIKLNYKTMFYKDIGIKLGRTKASIHDLCLRLNLHSGKRSRNIRDQTGDKNPMWKGGISTNHYHYKKIQIERYPEHVNARKLVYAGVKSGKLIKPNICNMCNNAFDKRQIHAHHEDYSKPLDIIWVCNTCHRTRL